MQPKITEITEITEITTQANLKPPKNIGLPSLTQRTKEVDEAQTCELKQGDIFKNIITFKYWQFEPYGMTKTEFITKHFPDSRASFYRIESELKVKKILGHLSDDNFPYSNNACQAMASFNNKYGSASTLELDQIINTKFNNKPTANLIKSYTKNFAKHGVIRPLSEYPNEEEIDVKNKKYSFSDSSELTEADISTLKIKLQNSPAAMLKTVQTLLQNTQP